MNDYYQNSKEAYANIKRKELDNYMVKFLKTPEYNKYVRNLSDSDSEKMNKALKKDYSLSRSLSYFNTICNTNQNNYKYSSNYNYSQRYSNNFFKPKRKKRWYNCFFKKKRRKSTLSKSKKNDDNAKTTMISGIFIICLIIGLSFI